MTSLAGCGGDLPVAVPQGPPAARHGERTLVEMTQVESARAALVSASDLYALERIAPARAHVRRGRELYLAQLGRGVRGRDRALHREVVAAFAAIDADLRGRAPLPAVRARVAGLSGQLLDGVEGVLVPAAARADAGARAEVLSRTLRALDDAYRAGVDGGKAREVERAYGLLARSQALVRGLADSLGPRKDAVLLTLSSARMRAYPTGVARPAAAAGEIGARLARVREVLDERYAL